MNDLPAKKQRRTRECENISKWIINKIVKNVYNGEPPCSLLTLYHTVYTAFKTMSKKSPSIYHEDISGGSHRNPDQPTPSVFVLWTLTPQSKVASRTVHTLIRGMIGVTGGYHISHHFPAVTIGCPK